MFTTFTTVADDAASAVFSVQTLCLCTKQKLLYKYNKSIIPLFPLLRQLSFLLDYFSQHLGEYLNVLSALEKLNVAILKAMDKTKEVRNLTLLFNK